MTGRKTLGWVALIFGALTVVAGGRALFGGADMGAVVPFVLWFNFSAGFAYMLAGYGLLSRKPWAASLAVAIFVATLLVGLAYGAHVLGGGAHETRTTGAMIMRTGVWAVIALMALRQQK
ncbi:hypothetical protein [Phaeovulum sp.]|uniref:hypothetical protein n=1 Tax=Phaeovulum sp. TaxID=2934796 RepID=UPI0039E4EA2D